jgi:N-acetylglutamate synthase-like GNAT family acetyltransferase
MVFDYLCNYPQYYNNVTDWMFNQWSYLFEDSNREEWLKNIIKRSNKNTVPEIIICIMNSKIVGTASLVKCDMDTHKHLTPWLASVYVAEEKRRKGIGTKIVKRMIQECKDLNINKLYLFTFDMMNFYKRLGWKTIEKIKYFNQYVEVMSLDIN